MAAAIPDEFLDLFRRPVLAHLATLMPDGSPHLTPVWIDLDGGHLLVNTVGDRLKAINMRERPAVALAIVDPDNPYRFLSVRGRVAEIAEAGAAEHVDRLARRYLGLDRYPRHDPSRPRLLFRIAPEAVTTQNSASDIR